MSEQDPFSLDEDESDVDERQSNSTIKQMRSTINRLEKQVKDMTPELEELRAFKGERLIAERNASIGSLFKQAGLNPSHAKLFAAVNPEGEPTPEMVVEFAKEYGLVEDKDDEGKPYTEVRSVDVEAGIDIQSTGIPPSQKGVEFDEWLKIAAHDPAEATRLKKQGRVIYPEAPWRTEIVTS